VSALLPASVRDDFPLLTREHSPGRPLIYLDSAATALKPRAVIDAVSRALAYHTGNIQRSVHLLGDEASEQFEDARRKVARLIGAETHEIIFVRNATEAINLVARCHPRRGRVLASLGEHHSNLLPWDRDRATLLPPTPEGGVDVAALARELAHGGVALVTAAHVSNVTGTRTDIRAIAQAAQAAGAALLVDAAQSVPHMPIDVAELGCDFLAFSGHKLGSPAGVGVLFGKAERLAELDWYLRGGGTVEEVAGGVPKPKHAPWRFEAGTPAVEAVIGLGAAVDYLQELGPDRVEAHCRALYAHARARLAVIPGVRMLGPRDGASLAGPLSFTVANALSHMLARGLSDGAGICVRSGYHCAQPLHEALGSPPSVRVSFAAYNQPWEIDRCAEALTRIVSLGGA
jgi:cysteine desulfurase / selenocysteine lyase